MNFPTLAKCSIFYELECVDEVKALINVNCLDKQKVKQVILKHFVHGYVGDGSVHSQNCRMCFVLKELGLDSIPISDKRECKK